MAGVKAWRVYVPVYIHISSLSLSHSQSLCALTAVEDYAGNPGNNKGLLCLFDTNDQLKSDIYMGNLRN